MYRKVVKRFFDFGVSLFGLIILSPIFLLIFLLLCIVNKERPFFVQKRPGIKGQIFKVIKFKTMNDKRDIGGNLLSDADRLTPLGAFIRKTSLDEIPQLINVLKGDMSLVGPRPLLVEYLPLYTAEQMRRHDVRPGITGWAQVNGRNAISWPKKFELDVYYVDHLSLFFDIKILWLTIMKVVKSEGISSNTSITMEKFGGK